MRYDDAVASLFQAPVEQFVTERKRLTGVLKAAGDKDAAARLGKLARPPISAWVVDQLWWHARPAFDALFETAHRLRDGKLDAMAAHREAIAALRAHAVKLLGAAEHGATEATLRRVTQTLAALAAAGGWDPDLPGALSADRDPPGFEAIGIANAVAAEPSPPHAPPHAPPPSPPHAPPPSDDVPAHTPHAHAAPRAQAKLHAHGESHATRTPHPEPQAETAAAQRAAREAAAEAKRRAEREATAARAEAAAALRRAEAERARAAAERHRIEAALRTAHGDVAQREREVGRLERELATARDAISQAQSVVAGLEERLAQLDN